ncbi:MAG: peptide deformylase, partial [Candidatus Marinimicrobia bacterium]|nr:peptide deformylase [Candidatus Neomarinimicrobiota bacterium]
MALMEVVHYGDPILRKKCKPVEDYKKLSGLIDDMFDTMYEENGIGLAANQVGVDLNLFIIDISDIEEEGESIHVFINGEIIESSGES